MEGRSLHISKLESTDFQKIKECEEYFNKYPYKLIDIDIREKETYFKYYYYSPLKGAW